MTHSIFLFWTCLSFKLQEYIDHTFKDQLTGFTIYLMIDNRNANFCRKCGDDINTTQSYNRCWCTSKNNEENGHKIDTNFYNTTCVSLISTHHLPGLIMDYTNYNGLI